MENGKCFISSKIPKQMTTFTPELRFGANIRQFLGSVL